MSKKKQKGQVVASRKTTMGAGVAPPRLMKHFKKFQAASKPASK